MMIRTPPSPEQAFSELAPLIPALQHSLEAGVQKAHAIWQAHYDGEPIDPWLYSNIVRQKARGVLVVEGVNSDYVVDVDLPFSGLACQHGRFDIRIWKGGNEGIDGGLPVPGISNRRLAFFRQEGFVLEGISHDGPWNLIVLWHLNSDGLLDSLSLACPKGANTHTAECYWHVAIPPEAAFGSPSATPEQAPDLPLVLNIAEESQG